MENENYQLSALELDEVAFARYFVGNGCHDENRSQLNVLEPLSRVNVFVGANSSGKSRFLRALAARKDYNALLGGTRVKDALDELRRLLGKANRLLEEARATNPDTPIMDIPRVGGFVPLGARSVFPDLQLVAGQLSSLKLNAPTTSPVVQVTREHPNLSTVRELGQNALPLTAILPEIPSRPLRVYIPTLRGLRPFPGHENQVPFKQRTEDDYFKDREDMGTRPEEIWTGMDLNAKVRKYLLGTRTERDHMRGYQEFLSKEFFGGEPVTLIPREGDTVLYITVGSEKEQPIYRVGDGIAQAIVLTFLPFMQEGSVFFFIEEPEVHMHPGLQRKLLRFLTSEHCARHHFFLTTHSNHLLDMSMDFGQVSVFNFHKRLPEEGEEVEKTPNFYVRPVNRGDRSSLELLGVRNSSVFLVNATIWVEGITDRLYLRRMLDLYQEQQVKNAESKKRKGHLAATDFVRVDEDVHFSFVEYGGANITHWSFLDSEDPSIEVERLCGAAFVVADKDASSWKEERHEKLKGRLKDRFCRLPVREIENLLPPRVLKEVVEIYERKADRESPSPVVLPEWSDYRDKPIGEFIQENMFHKGRGPKRRGGYKASSGTLKDKTEFCRRACEKLSNFEELAKEAQDVVIAIYEHVRGLNT